MALVIQKEPQKEIILSYMVAWYTLKQTKKDNSVMCWN